MAASTKALITEFASAPTPPSPPPSLLSPCPTYADVPLGYKAAMIRLRAASPPLVPSPPLLLPSTAHRDYIPEADILLWKRDHFFAPASGFEVGESSAAIVVTRQAGHALTSRVDYGFIDTIDAIIRAFESRAMTADGQDDRDLMRAQISLLTRERQYFRSMASSYEREEGDMVTRAFRRIHALEARDQARPDDLEDIDSSLVEMTMIAITLEVVEGLSVLVWFEKMEFVFHISNCTIACQIKFATCTLLGSVLTCWSSHVKTVGHDVAYGMTWKTLRKMMADNYTQRFQELALMCGKMFPEEFDEVEKYVGGLPDMIQGSVMTCVILAPC
ncbi:hypothetical protein Tco_0866928 [Tanacetum coccineum]